MFIAGGLTVVGANSAQRLINPQATGNPDAAARRVTNATISLNAGQTGYVVVGDSTVVATDAGMVGVPIYPGGSESLTVQDLADVYVAGKAGGERVSWHAKAV